MDATLRLTSPELDDEELQTLTRQLCAALDEEGVDAAPATRSPNEQEKSLGGVEVIGAIILKAVGAGGAIVALVNVLKAYVQRKPSLQFELQKKGGDKLKIKADDLRSEDMEKLVKSIENAIKEM